MSRRSRHGEGRQEYPLRIGGVADVPDVLKEYVIDEDLFPQLEGQLRYALQELLQGLRRSLFASCPSPPSLIDASAKASNRLPPVTVQFESHLTSEAGAEDYPSTTTMLPRRDKSVKVLVDGSVYRVCMVTSSSNKSLPQ